MRNQRFDRSARGDFAVVLPANAIAKSKQPSQSTRFVGRGGNGVPDKVFIVFADLSCIGKLGKFDFENASPRKAVAARPGSGGAERDSAVSLHFYKPVLRERGPSTPLRAGL